MAETQDGRYVMIEFIDGSFMKSVPEAWDTILTTFERRAEATVIRDGKLEHLIPLHAIKRVYRARANDSL